MKPKSYFVLTVFIIFLSTVLSVLCLIILNLDKTPSNTFVLNKDYSHLNRQQVIANLKTDFILPASLSLHYQDQQFELPLASVSAQIAISATADSLFPIFNFHQYFASLFTPRSFKLQISSNPEQLTDFLSRLSTQINQPFVPAELKIVAGPKLSPSILVQTGQLGNELDSSLLEKSIINHLSYYLIDQSLPLPVKKIGNLPLSDQIIQTKTKAENLLGKKLILTSPADPVSLEDQTLISWLNFDNAYDVSKINQYAGNLNQSLKKDPVDAVFKFENDKVLAFTPAVDGFTINQSSLVSQLQDKLTTLINSGQISLSLEIPVNPIKPTITTESVNDLGIKELLGRGTSTFKHSSTIRNYNIEKGASIVNRILVAPGKTFSFIKSLGEVTLATGYKEAYIIREGRTELDVGGGICQVSTTFFRAMLNAGVDIIERQHHAYRVSYYEEDMPPGYDATVFIPSPDLKFINDTGHYILIQSNYDSKTKKLTYEFYGTSDGRQVEINNYRRWGQEPAPPTVYIDDPALPPGKMVKEETAVAGLKTAFDWKVTRNGQIIHQKTFQSNFAPWAAVYRRGPSI